MNISLTPDLEKLIQAKVESGQYLSASEVVSEALYLLKERDQIREMRLGELRKEVQIGIDQADRGELESLDIHGTLARVRGRRRSAKGGFQIEAQESTR